MNISQYLSYSFKNSKGSAEFFVTIAWAYPLVSYVKAIVLRMPFGDVLGGFVFPFIYIVLFAMSAKSLTKNFRLTDLVFAFFLIVIYLFQMVLFPENGEKLVEYFSPLLLSLIPMYFVGIATDVNKVYKPMYIMSILCVLLQAVNTLYFESAERMAMDEREIREQMNTSYRILPFVLFCFWGWLRGFDFIGLLTSLIGLFLLVSFGSRGPVACTLLFIVLYILFYKAFKGKWFVVTMLGSVTLFVFFYIDYFFLLMQSWLSQFGLSTRIIDLAIKEEVVSHVSGRDNTAVVLISKLADAPFFGYGIGATYKFVRMYAHNIFLDVFISFGTVPGGIMLIALFFLFIKGWRSCKTMNDKGFMLVLFCCFAKLFISYTLYKDPSWMLLLGYCVGILRRMRQPKLKTEIVY